MGISPSEALRTLSDEVRELIGEQVTTHDGPPDPLTFYRDFVSLGRPCIFTDCITHWPALTRWNNEYLDSVIGDSEITVATTPNGRADAPPDSYSLRKSYGCFIQGVEGDGRQEATDPWFVLPSERSMKFRDFLTLLEDSRRETSLGVPYAQKQNGSFLDEFATLVGDADRHVDWATEAFGSVPDAVNLWFGDERASTWLHKDHYENMYAVVAGEKHFVLFPPVDAHRLYIQKHNVARYWQPQDSGPFEIVPEIPLRQIPWVTVDTCPKKKVDVEMERKFPRYFQGPPPITCTVKAGQLLYLPSLWYHHVSQSPDDQGRTIAINFWYDMRFDIRYAYYNTMQKIFYGED